MKTAACEGLTWETVRDYSGRKRPGRVSVVVNVPTGEIFPVPREQEHAEFLCELLGRTEEEIRAHPEYVERIVPVHIDLKKGEVNYVETGASGSEEVYKVRHEIEDLIVAHQQAMHFIHNGTVKIPPQILTRIDTRYAKK